MSIQLNLEVQEVQAALSALSKMPFEQVADLWFKIKAQAEQQLQPKVEHQATGAAPEEGSPE